jgi:Mg2+ and Co2+ transporter CorA
MPRKKYRQNSMLNGGPTAGTVAGVHVRLITPDGVSRRRPDEIEALLGGPGLVWIDVQYWDAETADFLGKRLHLHARPMHDCTVRNPVPKLHTYPDQTFIVLHAPEPGEHGHVHYVELDQFVGPNWLLTVHGPMNPAVPLDAAYVETSTVARRLDGGRLHPTRGCELSTALVNVLVGRLRDFLITLTRDVWRLEQQVTGGHLGEAEQFLEELFGVRHGLLAVHTIAATNGEIYGRMGRMAVFGAVGAAQLKDLEDQFDRVAAMADGQREYLQGVIDFYETRSDTKRNIAGERLAVIAALTLPVEALAQVCGMNVIVSTRTLVGPLIGILAVMLVISATLLLWTRRKGWW